MSIKRKAAFFDIDGTLIKGNLFCAFPDYLSRKGFFDKTANQRIQELWHLYKKGKVTYHYISIRIPDLYGVGIKGKKQSEILEFASAFMRTYNDLFPYSTSLVYLMNKNNFFTIAVSGAPIEVVSNLKSMAFKKIYGTEIHIRNGIYTGKVKRNLIISEEKRKLLASLIKKYKIDLKKSFAFGDTEQDLPMLSRVGNPIPLNPNPLLRKHAVKRGWYIPKDVMIEVNELVGYRNYKKI
jgi:HAD superfamily hydrolase (TIGR01490 family)